MSAQVKKLSKLQTHPPHGWCHLYSTSIQTMMIEMITTATEYLSKELSTQLWYATADTAVVMLYNCFEIPGNTEMHKFQPSTGKMQAVTS